MTSLPQELCDRTLETLRSTFDLTELAPVDGGTGGAYRTLTSAMTPEPVGVQRVFTGADGSGVAKVVQISMVVPMIKLDSHMIFAFTPEDSAVPHFTLDSVYGGDYHAFHLDLIPKVDLASHLTYLDHVLAPLTETYEQTSQLDGLSKAAIGPRQNAMMSPWMLVNRATAEAFEAMTPVVLTYLEHWSELVVKGLPDDVCGSVSDVDLAARDGRARANLFSPDVDHVWATVARLLGDELMEAVRSELLNNEVGT